MTLPGNVPKYRHPPESERFLKGTKSVERVKLDDKAMKRNAESIAHLTSGEIGQHYLGREPAAVRTNLKPLENIPNQKIQSSRELPSSTYKTSEQSNASQSGWNSNRSEFSDSQLSHRSHSLASFREGLSESHNKYLYTLNSLDSSFGKSSKRDLITASLPPRPAQELVWCATTIQHNALQSKSWALKLRKDG